MFLITESNIEGHDSSAYEVTPIITSSIPTAREMLSYNGDLQKIAILNIDELKSVSDQIKALMITKLAYYDEVWLLDAKKKHTTKYSTIGLLLKQAKVKIGNRVFHAEGHFSHKKDFLSLVYGLPIYIEECNKSDFLYQLTFVTKNKQVRRVFREGQILLLRESAGIVALNAEMAPEKSSLEDSSPCPFEQFLGQLEAEKDRLTKRKHVLNQSTVHDRLEKINAFMEKVRTLQVVDASNFHEEILCLAKDMVTTNVFLRLFATCYEQAGFFKSTGEKTLTTLAADFATKSSAELSVNSDKRALDLLRRSL